MLAHQGGWDEILMVVAPMLLVGGALVTARRRAADPAGHAPDDDAGQDPSGP